MPETAPAQGGAPATEAARSAPASAAVSTAEVSHFVQRLINAHGTVEAALSRLAGDQLKYRKRAQNAETIAKDLEAKIPAAGSVVLSGDDAKAFNDLKAMGISIVKVPEHMKEFKTLQENSKKTSRATDLATAAEGKYKPKVLAKLLGDIPIEFKKVNVRSKDKDGKDTITEENVPYVVLGEGTSQTRETLDSYLEREHADFADILALDDEEGKGSTGAGGTGGTRSASSGSSSSVVTTPSRAVGGKAKPGEKKEEVQAIVDKTLGGKYLSPSQERAQAAGGKAT